MRLVLDRYLGHLGQGDDSGDHSEEPGVLYGEAAFRFGSQTAFFSPLPLKPAANWSLALPNPEGILTGKFS
jgi:hypothetical protein